MKLAVTAIQNLKPRDRPYKVFDGEGLYLSISSAGGKSWKLSYRCMGQQKAVTVGPWPMISLADARARATELRRQAHDGIDPALEKQLRKFNSMMDRHSNFRAVAQEWLVKREKEGLGEATVVKTRWLLSLIYPVLASTLLNEMGDWHPDAIERQLGHIETNGVRRAYAHGEHWNERVRMIDTPILPDQMRARRPPKACGDWCRLRK